MEANTDVIHNQRQKLLKSLQTVILLGILPTRSTLHFSNKHARSWRACSVEESQQVLDLMTEKQTAYEQASQSPGKPVKSWNFIMAFSRTGKSWKESPGKKSLVLEVLEIC